MGSNILFLLTPKSQICYVKDDYTIRQVIEKMDYHHFTAVPILSKDGRYVGTITEGDLLWYIREKYQLNYSEAEKDSIKKVQLRRTYRPVTIDVDLSKIIDVAANQNYVPVLDDNGSFIGIVTRSKLISSLLAKANDKKEEK